MARLLLIRHGTTAWNTDGRLMGRQDPPLSDEGIRELDEFLSSGECLQWANRVVRVYSSPQIRASATAQALANAWGAPVTIADSLVERNFGELEGLSKAELFELLCGSVDKLEWSNWFPPGKGESVEDVHRRCMDFLRAIEETHPSTDTIAIVAHSIPLRLLAWILKGNVTPELREPIPARLGIQCLNLDTLPCEIMTTWHGEALCLLTPGTFVKIPSLPTRLGPQQARVALRFAVLCGSDYPKYAGLWDDFPTPLKPGMPIHECVGEVTESTIQGLLPGQLVLAMPKDDCGLGDTFIADADNIAVISDWPTEDLCVAALGQPTAAVLYGIDKLNIVAGEAAVVVGMGAIGTIAAQVLTRRGAHVMGIEPNPFRAQLAERILGIHVHCGLEPEEGMRGSVVVEAVGQDSYTNTTRTCLSVAEPSSRILLFGNPTQSWHTIPIQTIVRQNLTVIGSISPAWRSHLIRGLSYVKEHRTWFNKLITHRFHWHQAGEAFDLFGNPSAARLKILLHTHEGRCE